VSEETGIISLAARRAARRIREGGLAALGARDAIPDPRPGAEAGRTLGRWLAFGAIALGAGLALWIAFTED
jgi:hypothetical protein